MHIITIVILSPYFSSTIKAIISSAIALLNALIHYATQRVYLPQRTGVGTGSPKVQRQTNVVQSQVK